MNEWTIIGIVTLSSVLFAIGGTGFKFCRRFIMPVILAGGAFLLGISWWKCFFALFLIIGACHLGYGELHPLWRKVLTVLALGLCLLPLASGINGLLTLITPIVFGIGYYLSRKINWITWKLIELSAGFSMGVVVVLLVLTK